MTAEFAGVGWELLLTVVVVCGVGVGVGRSTALEVVVLCERTWPRWRAVCLGDRPTEVPAGVFGPNKPDSSVSFPTTLYLALLRVSPKLPDYSLSPRSVAANHQ